MSNVLIRIQLDGCFAQGFEVVIEFGEEGKYLNPMKAKLPPSREINDVYQRVLKGGLASQFTRKINKPDPLRQFKTLLDTWFRSTGFVEHWTEVLYFCNNNDNIRVILSSQDRQLALLPWHLWDFFDRHRNAEIAFSLPEYPAQRYNNIPRNQVKILAILGDSQNINIQEDENFLRELSPKTKFLLQSSRQEITKALWDLDGWDILFFAGHSQTSNGEGIISINETESLTMQDLRYALEKALERGLKIAIFNSCDGLGLAENISSLNIPQVIVMREPIPDLVAQEFLKYFLDAYSRQQERKTFYLAVREARERLQGLEGAYPCASILPVIYQNPHGNPPTWEDLNSFNPPKYIDEQVYQALSNLNYRKQLNKFCDELNTKSVGAYLIHGEDNCGQKWLLNRLIKISKTNEQFKVIPIEISRSSRTTSVEGLWRELRCKFLGDFPGDTDEEKIIEKISQCCQTQTVIISLNSINQISNDYYSKLLTDFWRPLVKGISDRQTQVNHRLLMFLIDYQGCVENWNGCTLEEAFTPIILPAITKLSENDIQIWLNEHLDDFTPQVKNNIRANLQAYCVSPSEFMDKFCQDCNIDFYDKERIWLKY